MRAVSPKQIPATALVPSDVIADPYIVGARLQVIDVQRSRHHVRLTVVRLRRFRKATQALTFRADETVTLLERTAVPVREPPPSADRDDVDSQDDNNG